MKLLPSLLCGLALLTTTSIAFAATAPAPAKPDAAAFKNSSAKATTGLTPAETGQINAPAEAAETPLKLDDYITELVPALNLSDVEKTEIHDLYAADTDALQKILNDASLSPLQKAQQVSDLRDVRNQKIESILHNLDRNHAFYQIEAVYRVALTKAVAESAPAPATPPPTLVPGAAATPEAAPLNSNPATPAPPVAKTAQTKATNTPATNAPAANAPATNAPAANPPPM